LTNQSQTFEIQSIVHVQIGRIPSRSGTLPLQKEISSCDKLARNIWKLHTSLLRKLCNTDEEANFLRVKMCQLTPMSVLPIDFVQIQVSLIVMKVGEENVGANMQPLDEAWQGVPQLRFVCQQCMIDAQKKKYFFTSMPQSSRAQHLDDLTFAPCFSACLYLSQVRTEQL
jgi:hypothetical protein